MSLTALFSQKSFTFNKHNIFSCIYDKIKKKKKNYEIFRFSHNIWTALERHLQQLHSHAQIHMQLSENNHDDLVR